MKIFYLTTSVPALVKVWACCEGRQNRWVFPFFFLCCMNVLFWICFQKHNDTVMAFFLHVWSKLMTVCQVYPQYFQLPKNEGLVSLVFCFYVTGIQTTLIHQRCFYFSRSASFLFKRWVILIPTIVCAQCVPQVCLETCEHHAKFCSLLENIKSLMPPVQKQGSVSLSTRDDEDFVGKGTNGCRVGAPRVPRNARLFPALGWVQLLGFVRLFEHLEREKSR